MKIKLYITFESFFCFVNDNDKDLIRLHDSFIRYLEKNIFLYQKCPRKGELIFIKDILREWAEKEHKETADLAFDELFSLIEVFVKVEEISHCRDVITLYCTDTYNQ